MRNYPKSTNNPGFLCASLSHDGSFLASFFAAQDLECVFVDVLGVKKSGISLAQLPSILKKKNCPSGPLAVVQVASLWICTRSKCANGHFCAIAQTDYSNVVFWGVWRLPSRVRPNSRYCWGGGCVGGVVGNAITLMGCRLLQATNRFVGCLKDPKAGSEFFSSGRWNPPHIHTLHHFSL